MNKRIYGERIKSTLKSKPEIKTQRKLAELLAVYELEKEILDKQQEIKELENKNHNSKQLSNAQNELANMIYAKGHSIDFSRRKEDLKEKYIRLISRWITFKAVPSTENIIAISEVLNVSVDYLSGKINFPLPSMVDTELQENLNEFRNKCYLLEYIQNRMGYDIDTTFNENGELLFYQLEREVYNFLTARFKELNITPKE